MLYHSQIQLCKVLIIKIPMFCLTMVILFNAYYTKVIIIYNHFKKVFDLVFVLISKLKFKNYSIFCVLELFMCVYLSQVTLKNVCLPKFL